MNAMRREFCVRDRLEDLIKDKTEFTFNDVVDHLTPKLNEEQYVYAYKFMREFMDKQPYQRVLGNPVMFVPIVPKESPLSNVVTVKLDARGSITIPAKMVREVSDDVYDLAVYWDNNKLYLSGVYLPKLSYKNKYTINGSYNVRLTKAVLKELPIRKKNEYYVSVVELNGQKVIEVS